MHPATLLGSLQPCWKGMFLEHGGCCAKFSSLEKLFNKLYMTAKTVVCFWLRCPKVPNPGFEHSEPKPFLLHVLLLWKYDVRSANKIAQLWSHNQAQTSMRHLKGGKTRSTKNKRQRCPVICCKPNSIQESTNSRLYTMLHIQKRSWQPICIAASK